MGSTINVAREVNHLRLRETQGAPLWTGRAAPTPRRGPPTQGCRCVWRPARAFIGEGWVAPMLRMAAGAVPTPHYSDAGPGCVCVTPACGAPALGCMWGPRVAGAQDRAPALQQRQDHGVRSPGAGLCEHSQGGVRGGAVVVRPLRSIGSPCSQGVETRKLCDVLRWSLWNPYWKQAVVPRVTCRPMLPLPRPPLMVGWSL